LGEKELKRFEELLFAPPLFTDPDAYYNGPDLQNCSIFDEPEPVTYAYYDAWLKAWCYLDDVTGKLIIQPRRKIEYLEFELEVMKDGRNKS